MCVNRVSPGLEVYTPLGKGIAKFMESTEDDVYWCVFMCNTGEAWWFRNQYIRHALAITEGIVGRSPIPIPSDMAKALRPHRERNDAR